MQEEVVEKREARKRARWESGWMGVEGQRGRAGTELAAAGDKKIGAWASPSQPFRPLLPSNCVKHSDRVDEYTTREENRGVERSEKAK